MHSTAKTVPEYLKALPPDRREAISKVREVILKNLPSGYEENMNWGMITYEIPLSRYPNTYNNQPLGCAALASQKHFMAVYLFGTYTDPKTAKWFKDEYLKTGKKLDMGKSCVRFRKLEDLPLELIGKTIAKSSVDELIETYEKVRNRNEKM